MKNYFDEIHNICYSLLGIVFLDIRYTVYTFKSEREAWVCWDKLFRTYLVIEVIMCSTILMI